MPKKQKKYGCADRDARRSGFAVFLKREFAFAQRNGAVKEKSVKWYNQYHISCTGVMYLTYCNIVMINGEERQLKDLTVEEQEQFADAGNRRAAEAVNYEEVKTV